MGSHGPAFAGNWRYPEEERSLGLRMLHSGRLGSEPGGRPKGPMCDAGWAFDIAAGIMAICKSCCRPARTWSMAETADAATPRLYGSNLRNSSLRRTGKSTRALWITNRRRLNTRIETHVALPVGLAEFGPADGVPWTLNGQSDPASDRRCGVGTLATRRRSALPPNGHIGGMVPKAGSTRRPYDYIWSFGTHRTAHSVAGHFGHGHRFRLLTEPIAMGLKRPSTCSALASSAGIEIAGGGPRSLYPVRFANGGYRETGEWVGSIRGLLEAVATLPSHAQGLGPRQAVLEALP
jgi:hypothetical protein